MDFERKKDVFLNFLIIGDLLLDQILTYLGVKNLHYPLWMS